MRHTETKLIVQRCDQIDGEITYSLWSPKYGEIGAVFEATRSDERLMMAKPDAERLAACWNACQGIPPALLAALPPGAIGRLVEAARMFGNRTNQYGKAMQHRLNDGSKDALTKVIDMDRKCDEMLNKIKNICFEISHALGGEI